MHVSCCLALAEQGVCVCECNVKWCITFPHCVLCAQVDWGGGNQLMVSSDIAWPLFQPCCIFSVQGFVYLLLYSLQFTELIDALGCALLIVFFCCLLCFSVGGKYLLVYTID